MASRRMSLSVHWDGQLDMDGNGPRYFGGRKKLIAIRSDTTYANFERRMYRLVNCNREECCLKYTIRCPTGANEYIAHDIVDDESLEGLIGLFEHYGCVSLSRIKKDLYPSETQYQSQGYYTSLLHNNIDVGFPENPIGDREVDNEQGTESVSTCATLDFTCATLDVTCRTVDVTCATLDVTCATLDVTCRTLDVTCATVDVTCATLDVTCRTLDVTCATVDVTCATSMSRDEPRIFHTPNENYDWGLSTPYTNWNKVLDNIVDEGDDNDGNQDNELIHNDGHQENAPIDNDAAVMTSIVVTICFRELLRDVCQRFSLPMPMYGVPVENAEGTIRVYAEVELARGGTVTEAVRCWSSPSANIDEAEKDAARRSVGKLHDEFSFDVRDFNSEAKNASKICMRGFP
uniref:Uncharacterized protein n=1 Tax=Ananas comosus var. bracteatus TaxID=296719 RepID=A0A6V7PYI0_ANACO|nr:unnamed protein product [Ananas comosus var. bracteatus]